MTHRTLRRSAAATLAAGLLLVGGALATASASTSPTPAPVDVTDLPTPGPSVTTTTPTPVQDFLGCRATFTVVAEWPGGFVASVRVTNVSSAFSLGTWRVQIPLPDGEVTNAWSATLAGTDPATFRPAAWNGSLPYQGETEFGFQGTGSPEPDGRIVCLPY